jgi:hypothetical protein
LGDFEAMNVMRLNSWVTAALCVPLLYSCATRESDRPVLAAEAQLNKGAGSKDWLYLTLHLENGENLLFHVDTGAPVTVLDRSLEPQLGKRLRATTSRYAWREMTGGIYKAPKLYLGDTRLWTSDTIWTADLESTNIAGQQVMGVLGMDCLRHYAIQLDFAAARIRFLDPGQVAKEGLGRAFPLTVYPAGASGYVTVHQSFTGTKGVNPILDTGCLVDGVLEPKEFQLELREQKAAWTNEYKYPTGFLRCTAFFPKAVFAGETYTNLTFDRAPALIGKSRTYYINAIGLPFLARHLVTLNFPQKTMYLRRTDVGPLTDQSVPP